MCPQNKHPFLQGPCLKSQFMQFFWCFTSKSTHVAGRSTVPKRSSALLISKNIVHYSQKNKRRERSWLNASSLLRYSFPNFWCRICVDVGLFACDSPPLGILLQESPFLRTFLNLSESLQSNTSSNASLGKTVNSSLGKFLALQT